MRAAIDRALALDPDLADAHAQRASMLQWYDWRSEEAEKEYLTALRLDSTNVSALAFYPMLLRAQLRDDSALVVGFRSIRTNPTSNLALGYFFQWNRQGFRRISADSGATICKRFDQIGAPRSTATCNAFRLSAVGQSDSSHLVARRAAPTSTSANDWIRWAWFTGRIGDTTTTRAAITRAVALAQGGYLREDMVALSYCALRDKEEALRWWARGRASRSAGVTVAWAECPGLRSDPRFRAAIGEENVPK